MTNAHISNQLAKELLDMVQDHHFERDIELVNGHAGIVPISVTPELYSLIAKSIRLQEITRGDFDIFERSGPAGSEQNEVEINPLLLSVYLPHSGIRIDLGKILTYGQA